MPVGWAAAGAAVAGVAGSVIQGEATKSAAKSATNEQRAAREQARADLMPYSLAGQNALAPAQNLLGLNGQDNADAAMANFQASPGYQYQLQQGLRAVDAGAAAKGMLRSGATLKAEQTLGNNLAAQDFGTYYNRLMGLVQSGQASAAGQAAGSLQTGAGIAQTAMSLGGAQASIYGDAARGIGNGLNQYANGQSYQNSLYGGGGNVGNAANGYNNPNMQASDAQYFQPVSGGF
jgi:hypothetical protein